VLVRHQLEIPPGLHCSSARFALSQPDTEHLEAVIRIVATASVTGHLPPELIRKGRLDEVFFVDLPDAATRAEIFAIQLRKRELNTSGFDIPVLAALTEGFSGAEIEQAIVASLYLAREQQMPFDTAHIRSELSQTQPLSRAMTEKMSRMRTRARDRTVLAN